LTESDVDECEQQHQVQAADSAGEWADEDAEHGVGERDEQVGDGERDPLSGRVPRSRYGNRDGGSQHGCRGDDTEAAGEQFARSDSGQYQSAVSASGAGHDEQTRQAGKERRCDRNHGGRVNATLGQEGCEMAAPVDESDRPGHVEGHHDRHSDEHGGDDDQQYPQDPVAAVFAHSSE